MAIQINNKDALIVVDVQNDFCSGGALEVPGGDSVVPEINKYISLMTSAGGRIFATRDWHPINHGSFKTNGGPWPQHCVQGTFGAEIHGDVDLPAMAYIIDSGVDHHLEGYSGFEGTELEKVLNFLGVGRLFIGGIATDYCVKHTVLDALDCGFIVHFLQDASIALNVSPQDGEKAVSEMVAKGAINTVFKDLEL